jgi:hypothetical protein
MRALSEEDFAREAKPVYEHVFATGNPFESPFTSVLESRMILFPVHYMMETSLARAITKASAQLNENSFYLSVLERPTDEEHDRPYHWHIGFSEFEQYRSLGYPFVLENAVYSDRGTWGLMFSHERHAVLGGPAEFVQVVAQELPKLTDQVENFVETWKKNQKRLGSKVDWLPRLLKHVYGDERAQDMLVKADLPLSVEDQVPRPKESIASKMGT